MTKRTNAAIADGLLRDAKRFNSVRLLALMTEPEREKVLEKLGDRVYIVGEAFDNWVDELTSLLAKAKRNNRRRSVPDED